tara:strand:+ start:248 stop:466 length:219 start_codon:yes stop_codon:yes gene_type:complete
LGISFELKHPHPKFGEFFTNPPTQIQNKRFTRLVLTRARKLMAVGNQLNSPDAEVTHKDASGVAKRWDKSVL